jgi:hypothetical protein
MVAAIDEPRAEVVRQSTSTKKTAIANMVENAPSRTSKRRKTWQLACT